MKITNYDIIGNAAALDRQAAVVRDGKGEVWDPEVKTTNLHWDVCPPLKRPRPDAPQLQGTRKGRLLCVGLLDPDAAGVQRGDKKKAAWVCRCDCGHFEARTAKALHNPLNDDDMCGKCSRLKIVQKRASGFSTRESRKAEAARLDAIAGGAK